MDDIRIYMAPLEGITGYVYRNTFDRYFGGIDKYFTPFIAPAKGRPLRTRELKDVQNRGEGMKVVPQLLTNSGEGFVRTARYLKELGYDEVNINLGCPSKTVVTKCKGSGLLYEIERLDNFLYEVFEADVMRVSVKTRIGRDSATEFDDIIDVYRKYPISELIIHPRLQTDYYSGVPDMKTFAEGVDRYGRCDNVCYNGDIRSVSDCEKLCAEFPDIHRVMLGRGLLANPFLAEDIKGANAADSERMGRLFAFHDELFENYCSSDVGRSNVLFKMKELWSYMGISCGEAESSHIGRLLKKIRKSKNIEEYIPAVNDLRRNV